MRGLQGMANETRCLTFRFLAEPGDVNFNGKVHGGTVMKWIDQAGYACAVRWTSRYCVTASIGGVEFLGPVRIGSLVTVQAQVVATGRTSLRVVVSVSARDLRSSEEQLTTHCTMVFVALDDDGKPTPVPLFTPETPEELRLAALAVRISALSHQLHAEMRQGSGVP
jgi:acyl-CoA hydrolase